MILSTLLSVATAISISSHNPTTFVFKEPIEFVSIGKTGDFSFFINNSKKVIVLQPLKQINKTEMVVVTANKNYQFRVHIDEEKADSYYEVVSGSVNSSYSLKKKSESLEVYEGASSLMIKNVTDTSVLVNGNEISKRSSMYLPKGGAVYLNSERIY